MNPAMILLFLAVPAQAAAEDGRADERARAAEFLGFATNEAKAYSLQWNYALARMTHAQLSVSYRGRELWKVPLLDPKLVFDHREPYTKFRFEDEEPAAGPGER
jgi:hypothetical protein